MSVNTFSPLDELYVILERPVLKIVKVVIDVNKRSHRIKQKGKSQTFVMFNDNPSTTPTYFSSIILYNCSPPPKLGVEHVDSHNIMVVEAEDS